MPILNVTPEKRIFLSIISEYDLKLCMCELIDNAIDLWTKNKTSNLSIKIELDEKRQTISIEDNAGGLEENKLDHLLSPGKTSNDIADEVIGYFGVGSKRAVVALAQDISIYTRFEKKQTFMIHFDDDWINDDPSWELPYAISKKNLYPNTTSIELFKLRVQLTGDEITVLQIHLAEVYANFIQSGVSISVNGTKLSAINFMNDWSFPTSYSPISFNGKLEISDRNVEVEIISGLINKSGDSESSYGVFFYCNDRLIGRGLTDFSVGFVSGLIGTPHYNISLARTIVFIKGQSRDMPWNSSKSGIDTRHAVFQALRSTIVEPTKKYAQVCRSLQGHWETEIFPYKKGKIVSEHLEGITNIPKIYLLTPPPSRKTWQQKVVDINSDVVSEKPWTNGLQDSIVAGEIIFKTSLAQKNRIALIILDSTLEIAYKEYLVNEMAIGKSAFDKLGGNRSEVQKKVLETIKIDEATFKKIEHYYKLRNDLIHQRATPNVSDSQVEDYRGIVQELLNKMFGLQF